MVAIIHQVITDPKAESPARDKVVNGGLVELNGLAAVNELAGCGV